MQTNLRTVRQWLGRDRAKRLEPTPNWSVAWGNVDTVQAPGIWRDDQVVLLAPSHSSDSCCISHSERFVVFGDVWLTNQVELLEQVGENLNSWQGDDRALVALLWERYKTATWERLVGAFSLVIWDRQQRILWAGRDRSGIYTLYYTTQGATRWIAPQLSTLAPHHTRDLDLIALRDYLTCAFVPGDRTLWQQVRELRPGTSLSLPAGKTQAYWQLQEQVQDAEQPLQWYGDRLRSLLNQVVQDYLPSDEPVGVFLSGGLDSSCVTALAAKFHSAPVHTYSIHFGVDCPNELEFSSLVAHHCQTEHRILEISFRDMWKRLPEVMMQLDDPIGDPLTVPNFLLGRLAQRSVSVVLNGEGGDPCFGGPKNQPMLINNLYGSINQQDALQAYLISFQKCALDLPNLLRSDIWQTVSAAPWLFSEELNSSASYLNRLMALNIKFKGADHILTKVNNLMRSTGVAGRSPLFDQRIVDLSMQIPPEYKLSGVQEKAVLKQAVADLLPTAIIQRPKSGMMVPVQLGFRQHWQKPARDLLLSRRAAIAPYLNQTLIRNWLNFQGDTWNRYGVKLWLLASLEFWLQGRR